MAFLEGKELSDIVFMKEALIPNIDVRSSISFEDIFSELLDPTLHGRDLHFELSLPKLSLLIPPRGKGSYTHT